MARGVMLPPPSPCVVSCDRLELPPGKELHEKMTKKTDNVLTGWHGLLYSDVTTVGCELWIFQTSPRILS